MPHNFDVFQMVTVLLLGFLLGCFAMRQDVQRLQRGLTQLRNAEIQKLTTWLIMVAMLHDEICLLAKNAVRWEYLFRLARAQSKNLRNTLKKTAQMLADQTALCDQFRQEVISLRHSVAYLRHALVEKNKECSRFKLWAGTGWAGCIISTILLLVAINSDGRMPVAVSFSIVGGVGGFEVALALLRFSFGRKDSNSRPTTITSEPAPAPLGAGSLVAA